MAFVDATGLHIKVVYCSAEPALLAEVMRKLRSSVDPKALGTVFIEPNEHGVAAFDFALPQSLAVRGKTLRVHAYGAPSHVPADKRAILLKGADAGVFVVSEDKASDPATQAEWIEFMGNIFSTQAVLSASKQGLSEGVRRLVGPKVPILDAASSENPGFAILKPVLKDVLSVVAP